MDLRGKIYKLQNGALVSTNSDIDIPSGNVGNVTTTLEKDATDFRYGQTTVRVENLPEDYFSDFDGIDIIYLFELQYGPDPIDGDGNEVIFYGIIDRDSIRYTLPSQSTSFRVYSIEKLIELSPGIVPRGIYKTGLAREFRILGGGGWLETELNVQDKMASSFLTALEPYISPAVGDGSGNYMEQGATYVFKQNYGEQPVNIAFEGYTSNKDLGSAEYRTIDRGLKSGGAVDPKWENRYVDIPLRTQIAIPTPLRLYNQDNKLRIVDTYHEEIIRNPWIFYQGYLQVYVPSSPGPYDKYGFYIEGIEVRIDNVDNTYVRFEINALNQDDYINNVDPFWNDPATKFYLVPEMVVEAGAEVEIYDRAIYGKYDTPTTEDYEASVLLEGLFDLVPVFADLDVTVEMYGTPRRMSRLFTLSNTPSEALKQIQVNCNILIDFVPNTIVNGKRGVTLKCYTREYLSTVGAENINIPTSWSENPTGTRPTVVVEGSGPLNVPIGSDKAYGWFIADANGIDISSEFTSSFPSGDEIIKIEAPFVVPSGVTYYDGGLRDFYYNDPGLKDFAREFFEFFAGYYREADVALNDISTPALGALVNENYQGKQGILFERKINYLRNTTTLKLKVGNYFLLNRPVEWDEALNYQIVSQIATPPYFLPSEGDTIIASVLPWPFSITNSYEYQPVFDPDEYSLITILPYI